MLDLAKYDSLGAALRDALARWPAEVCLIEADRERENLRPEFGREIPDAVRATGGGDHARPLGREPTGHRRAEAAARTGNEDDAWLAACHD